MGKTKRREDLAEMEDKIRELEARISRKRRKMAKMTNESVTPSLPLPQQLEHQERSLTPELIAEQLTEEEKDISDPESEPAMAETASVEPIEPQPGCSNLEPDTLPEEFLLALGDEGTVPEEKGKDIRKEIADRWTNIIISGIKKESLSALLKKYQTPGNFPMATAPKLNSEIVAAISDNVLKRDKKFEYRQNLTGKVLSCLGAMLSEVMNGNINSIKMIESINDAGKILCNMNHYDALTRRHFVLTSLQNCVKQAVTDVPIGTFLFGENLGERLKTAKAVERSSSQLKMNIPKKPPAKFTPQPKNLNWKSPSQRPPQHDYKYRGGPKNHTTRRNYKQHQPRPARRR